MLAVSVVPTGAMVLLVAASTVTPVGAALAVMDSPEQQQLDQAVPAQPVVNNMKLDLPVAWQLTRARLAGSGTSTLTESFQETWTFELRAGGAMFLASPRGRVPVYPSDALAAAQESGIPTSIVMAESDLARLVGLPQMREASPEDQDGIAASTRPVRLVLNKPAKSGTDITLSLSDDEHFAIHIDIGTQAAF